mmetsp:Transcript_106967/g.300853  ORF Transcript_106967/g.300853 Transcript_106967/m.300853 type:complete len:432 (-) Transcript_106967:216-1511(-)
MVRSLSRSRSRSRPLVRGLEVDVEAFLRAEPQLEERAVAMLRSRPPEVQQLVIKRGGLAGTRNPTAVLVSRIRNAEEGLKPVLDSDKASEVVERFLVVERIEAHAAARLRKASKYVQETVVSRGSLSGTRDPTAVLMTRIRDAEREAPPGEAQPTPAQQAAAVDPNAAANAMYAQMMQQPDYTLAYLQYQQYQAYQAATMDGDSQAAVAGQSDTSVAAGDSQVADSQGYLQAAAGYASYANLAAAYPQLPGGYPQMAVGSYLPAGTVPALTADSQTLASGDTQPAADGEKLAACGEIASYTQMANSYSQMVAAYPQVTAGYPQMVASYPAVAGAYPTAAVASTGALAPGVTTGYPAIAAAGGYAPATGYAAIPGYPQMASGFPTVSGYPQVAGYPQMPVSFVQAADTLQGTAPAGAAPAVGTPALENGVQT